MRFTLRKLLIGLAILLFLFGIPLLLKAADPPGNQSELVSGGWPGQEENS